jgi:hypothetical protein
MLISLGIVQVVCFEIHTSSTRDECTRLVEPDLSNRLRGAQKKVTKDVLCRSNRCKENQLELRH